MPEGPEVTLIVQQLNSLLHDKYLRSITIKNGPYLNSTRKEYQITKRRIIALNKKTDSIKFKSVNKHGKFIYFILIHDNKDTFIIGNTLGMTGEWHLITGDESVQNTKLELGISDTPDGSTYTICFSDQRNMGKLWVESQNWLATKLKELGPDIISDGFTLDIFKQLKSSKPIYMAIVDQNFISGIGNYLRAEILAESGLDPFMIWDKMTASQKETLYNTIVRITKQVVQSGGVSEEDRFSYRDLFGNPGRYRVKYYGQKTAPDGTAIKTIKDSKNRTFHYV